MFVLCVVSVVWIDDDSVVVSRVVAPDAIAAGVEFPGLKNPPSMDLTNPKST